MSQFYTYMVECADGSLYTGWTVDLKQRVAAHNGEIPGGAKYTRTRRPVSSCGLPPLSANRMRSPWNTR